MPTHEEADTFSNDFAGLTREQRSRFLSALARFIADVSAMEAGEQDAFRAGLRVKSYRGGPPGVMEMTWADDGRALWRFGEPQRDGLRHVEWLRVGTHDIF